MIPYTVNKWGFSSHMFMIRGSVFPKALVWAIPTAVIAAAVWYYQNEELLPDVNQSVRANAAGSVMNGFAASLGFLLIFRTQKAYHRYWECAMHLQKARGEWFNATSNLVSFCTPKNEKRHNVHQFQNQLIRLISLLFNSAIGEVCSIPVNYEVLDPLMDEASVVFLQSKAERCEIVMQWIQRLVVDRIRDGTVEIAPPIVSRVFQEFSLGIVNIAAAKKITKIPFPFPYSQMMQMLLVFQAVCVPVVAGYAYHEWWVASGITFGIVLLSWCIHFTACELEMPFGDDANDLPLAEMVTSMNDSLCNLLEEQSRVVPRMHIKEAQLGLPLGPRDKISWSANSETNWNAAGKEPLRSEKKADEAAKRVAVDASVASQMPSGGPPSGPPGPPATSEINWMSEQMQDSDVTSRLYQLSSQIEGQLTQIGRSVGVCPRMEEGIDKLSLDVKQIGIAALMFIERLDRMDNAGMMGRGHGVDANHVYFVPPGRGVGDLGLATPRSPPDEPSSNAPRSMVSAGVNLFPGGGRHSEFEENPLGDCS